MMQVKPTYSQLYHSRRSFDLKSQTSTQGDQNEFYNQSLHHHKQNAKVACKTKTSLCKNFTEKGYCPYGKKCQFAHGPEELRINMEHNRSYKTKNCHAFAKKGYCCYGERCNFIHEQPPVLTAAEKWSIIYSNHRQTINPSEFNVSSRLLKLLKQ